MEKVDEKERYERDRAIYRQAWNDGYDEGIYDGKCGRVSKLKDVEYPNNSFPTVIDQGWEIGYKVGYEEGVYERCREAALKIKEEREDGKKDSGDDRDRRS